MPQPNADAGAVLALDPGSVRVGVAASVPGSTIATPIGSMPRDPAVLWPRLLREVSERGVRLIVVGLPRTLDGGEGDAAADARTLAAEAAQRTGLPCELWDERFTTAQAERDLVAAGVRRRRRREVVDAAAATLLLQSWLDSPQSRTRTRGG
ncbi:MAG: Holliday junction resolvase RuvX [Candidatus Dormibacteria bacterium]